MNISIHYCLRALSFAFSDDGYSCNCYENVHDNNENVHDNNKNVHGNNKNIHDYNGHLQRSYGHIWYRDSTHQLDLTHIYLPHCYTDLYPHPLRKYFRTRIANPCMPLVFEAGVWVGVVLGAILVVVIIGVIMYCICKRRKKYGFLRIFPTTSR